MGANSRTYKFALADALLEHATAGREDVTLLELADPYAMRLVEHAQHLPQAPLATELGDQDFLQVADEESKASLAAGRPTERLVAAAARSMPGMVMQKFHNLNGGVQVPHGFYEIRGRGKQRLVVLSPDLLRIASEPGARALRGELDARWSIVENSFASGIGASLINEGVVADLGRDVITDKLRRRSLAGVREAVGGFLYDRCIICNMALDGDVAIDHVFPFSLMSRRMPLGWEGLDLDSIWNLAPAHAGCNGAKSNRPPSSEEVHRLADRNAAIMLSPHPLKRTLERTLRARGYAGGPNDWYRFLQRVLRV
ncbi:HNH endonuclease [Nocardioides sp. HDW12B]|nr:HNH endonuclease [Nocardioides sp. HDW12B]